MYRLNHKNNYPHILSTKLSSGGIPSLRPFLFLISFTVIATLVVASSGSPLTTPQWSKTHCGKA